MGKYFFKAYFTIRNTSLILFILFGLILLFRSAFGQEIETHQETQEIRLKDD